MIAARLALLLVAVAGAVFRPFRVPAFVLPLACSALALVAGLIDLEQLRHALAPLAAPLGFLLAAIPLAVLLDRLGYFEELAGLFGDGPLLLPGLWLLAMVTVAVLNLDAAVVLLTPLYVRIAQQTRRSPRFLGFQPVILALLASSFIPVSNLTNLIAAARTGIGPLAILEHLGLASAVASGVGYFLYRGASSVAGRAGVPQGGAESGAVRSSPRRDVLLVGSAVVVVLLVGFVLGPSVGIEPWMVALAGDAVLVLLTRGLPVSSLPWETALVAGGLGVVAAVAAEGLRLGGVLSGSGVLATLREAGAAALGANVVNNLPAFLVALPFVTSHGDRASCALWPVLYGVNAGPSLLLTGSLASLLWVTTMNRLEVHVSAGQFVRMGLRVGLPAALCGLAVLLALAPVLGCG